MTERRMGLQEFSLRTASSVASLFRCTVLKLPVWVRGSERGGFFHSMVLVLHTVLLIDNVWAEEEV